MVAGSDIEAMADLLLSLFDQEADFKPDRARGVVAQLEADRR